MISSSFSHSLLQLGEKCGELKDIHLGQCYSITDDGMVALAKGCRKLQKLYLQENKLVSCKHIFVLFLSLLLPLALASFCPTWPADTELFFTSIVAPFSVCCKRCIMSVNFCALLETYIDH